MGAGGFWSWLWGQIKDPKSLYRYGDLEEQRALGKKSATFGIEQRASIVEDYFKYLDEGSPPVNGTALEAYALEILR